MTPAERVRSFYAALDAGDAEAATACLVSNATDDGGEEGPTAGAEAIVARRLDAHAQPEARWALEALLADDELVAVQCMLTWREPDGGDLEAQSDSEWLTVRDGLIAEIRSYRGSDEEDDGPVIGEDDFDWSLLETDEQGP